jgi:hypothetical protein
MEAQLIIQSYKSQLTPIPSGYPQVSGRHSNRLSEAV